MKLFLLTFTACLASFFLGVALHDMNPAIHKPIPDAIFIQPNPELKDASQREKDNAVCVLFTELVDCVRRGSAVNIDDPENIIVCRPLS
jgi:hypothetical protein